MMMSQMSLSRSAKEFLNHPFSSNTFGSGSIEAGRLILLVIS
jgi:hypothetical protein